MKKLIIALIIAFLIYASAVNIIPAITDWDRSVIIFVQNQLNGFPLGIPTLLDSGGYAIGLIIPLVAGIIYFIRKYLLIDLVLFCSAPVAAYVLNSVLKMIIARPRPPLDLQIVIHPSSFSFVSNHTFITSALWGLVIFYLLKYCQNKFIKYFGITTACLWMFFVGFSRVWLGVHNPTDVIGGYFLALILVLIYIRLINLIGGKS